MTEPDIPLYVFAAVIGAAAMHAGWNAILKISIHPFLAANLVAFFAGLIALPALVYFGFPARASWPYLAGSILVHIFYYWTLTEAYRHADMGQVYPIARGTAPLLTAVVSLVVLKEPIGLVAACGIAVLGAGIVYMAKAGGNRLSDMNPAGVRYALLTAVIISTYTVFDGLGARAAGDAHSYVSAYFVIDGISVLAMALIRFGARDVVASFRHCVAGFAGGAMSLGAYWIAIWAMTIAPIGIVAALRETSVLFAVGISTLILKERLSLPRVVACLLILGGIVLIRL